MFESDEGCHCKEKSCVCLKSDGLTSCFQILFSIFPHSPESRETSDCLCACDPVLFHSFFKQKRFDSFLNFSAFPFQYFLSYLFYNPQQMALENGSSLKEFLHIAPEDRTDVHPLDSICTLYPHFSFFLRHSFKMIQSRLFYQYLFMSHQNLPLTQLVGAVFQNKGF